MLIRQVQASDVKAVAALARSNYDGVLAARPAKHVTVTAATQAGIEGHHYSYSGDAFL
jgi:hypothetical protein